MLAITMSLNIFCAKAQVKFEAGSIEQLVLKAENAEKLLFVDLYATWCPPCKQMERDVFPLAEVGAFMSKNFISAKFNVDDVAGGDLSRKFNVRSIPTYLIFDGSGQLVGRLGGAMSPKEFMEALQNIIDNICS